MKAGLKSDCWKEPKTEIFVFTAEVFGEKDLMKSAGS
jgi:AMMECR1 domain-containing protein